MRNILILLLLALFSACAEQAPAPVEPVWGKHACAHCMMILSDRRSAAQAQLKDGTQLFFDDVGCLMAWSAREGDSLRATWVRGLNQGWQDARSATFSTGNSTPMDYGLLPAKQGLSYEAARALIAARRPSSVEISP